MRRVADQEEVEGRRCGCPTDIRRVTRPARSSTPADARAARRASGAPRGSRPRGVLRPVEQQQDGVAAPLDQARARRRTRPSSSAAKVALRMSLISSAPTLPLRASRSVSLVKPEMSTKASVPSTSRYRSARARSAASRRPAGARTGAAGGWPPWFGCRTRSSEKSADQVGRGRPGRRASGRVRLALLGDAGRAAPVPRPHGSAGARRGSGSRSACPPSPSG